MKLTALLYFVLSLVGFDLGGSNFVTRAVVDDVVTLRSKATAGDGVAHFQCLRSASGQCYYTVFRRDCEGCTTAAIEHFAVAVGDSRQVAGLHGFSLCVATDGRALAPDCMTPPPPARASAAHG